MIRLIKYSFFLALLLTLLAACNNESANDAETEQADEMEETTSNEQENEEKQNNTKDEENTDVSSNNGDLPEDQLGLAIGDTGHIKNNFSEYEITLNSVEILDNVAEEAPINGAFVITDITLTNLSDEPLSGSDAFSSTFLATDSDSTGFSWFTLDGIAEEWPEDIAPGKSHTDVLLFDLPVSDFYALNSGQGYTGLSNAISFEFTSEESK